MVYYRVPEPHGRDGRRAPAPGGARWPRQAPELKDTPIAGWLEHELGRRAPTHECVETMAEFRRMPRAITKAGQVKGSGGRHAEDDRFRIDNHSRYVLGWSNQRKLDALLDRAGDLWPATSARSRPSRSGTRRRGTPRSSEARCSPGWTRHASSRRSTGGPWCNRAEELRAEQRELEAASAELAGLTRDLDAVKKRITDQEGALRALDGRLGGLDNRQHAAEGVMHDVREILAEDACGPPGPSSR